MAEEMKQCCACRHKETERADDLQHDLTKRLNRAIGQLNGVKDMIADNRYCGDVLVQLAAAESAVHRIAEIVLQDHMETCVVEQVRAGNVEVVDEAMRLISTGFACRLAPCGWALLGPRLATVRFAHYALAWLRFILK